MATARTGRGTRVHKGAKRGTAAQTANAAAVNTAADARAAARPEAGVDPRIAVVSEPEGEVYEFAEGPVLAISDANPDASPFGSPLDEEDRASETWDEETEARVRRSVSVAIAFTTLPDGTIVWEVQQRGRTGVPYDDYTRALAGADLDRLARAVSRMQPDAIRASTLLDAFYDLDNVTGAQLGAQAKKDGAYFSRWQRIVVEINSGLVPLDFFTWKNWDKTAPVLDKEGKPVEDEEGKPILEAGPKEMTTGWIVEYWNLIRGATFHGEPSEIEKSIAGDKYDALYQYRKLLFSLKQNWLVVEDHRRRWPLVGRDSLVEMLRSTDPAAWEEWVTRTNTKTRATKRTLVASPGSSRVAALAMIGFLEEPSGVDGGSW